MGDRALFEVIRGFLHRRLVLPLVFLAMVTTGGLVAWRIGVLEREHEIIAWGIDNYLTSFLTSADETLRLMAFTSKGPEDNAVTPLWNEAGHLYHRVFLVARDSYAVFIKGKNAPASWAVTPPPASSFPDTGTWPVYSIPYYRADLGSVTIAFMIPGRWGSIIGEVNLDRLHWLISAYLRKVPQRILWITDRYGNVIVHPDERMVKEQENVGHEPLVRKALAHPEGVKLLGRLAGTLVYGLSWRIDPWGWVVLAAYPLLPALMPVLGAAAVGFALFFAFLYVVFRRFMGHMHRSVIEPVQILTREASRMAEASRPESDPWPDFEGSFAELQVFSRQFQEMGRAVRDREEALVRRQAELVRIQDALARSEAKYREIVESLHEAYLEINTEGVVTFHNTAFLQLMDMDAPPSKPFSVRDMADPETVRAMVAFLDNVAAGRDVGELKTFALRDRHGVAKTVEISARPMGGPEGPVRGFRIMARDVTAKIEGEKRAKELEKIIAHAQKMESLGTLASGIAHEFNNLLQAMTGYLDLLEKHTDASDRKRRWIDRVREAADRGAELVRRMLTFARQDGVSPELLDINRVIEETLDFLSRNIPRMIQLEADLAPDVPAVYGDRLQLEQIVINLIVNARDAIPEGGHGRITVSTRRDKRPDGTDGVVLKVSDTGQGIPERIRERIFDPFFTTKEPGKGTGLGLSTVYGIMQRHGGTITCESEPGRGTTFTLTFPVKEARGDDAAEGARRAEGALLEVKPERRDGLTVLVVDDETALLQFVTESLEAEGFRVLKATSGEEALHVLEMEGRRIGAVVLDLHMPGMGGGACYKEIRRRYPRLSVVLTSGYTGASLAENLGKAENVSILAKPYRLADLLAILYATCSEPAVVSPA
ncbi:hybrid sensor histidine kinase/response regulator [Desulfosoma sp.]